MGIDFNNLGSLSLDPTLGRDLGLTSNSPKQAEYKSWLNSLTPTSFTPSLDSNGAVKTTSGVEFSLSQPGTGAGKDGAILFGSDVPGIGPLNMAKAVELPKLPQVNIPLSTSAAVPTALPKVPQTLLLAKTDLVTNSGQAPTKAADIAPGSSQGGLAERLRSALSSQAKENASQTQGANVSGLSQVTSDVSLGTLPPGGGLVSDARTGTPSAGGVTELAQAQRFEAPRRRPQMTEGQWLQQTYGPIWRTIPSMRVVSFEIGQLLELRDRSAQALPGAYNALDERINSLEMTLAEQGLRPDPALVQEGRVAVQTLSASAFMAAIARFARPGQGSIQQAGGAAGRGGGAATGNLRTTWAGRFGSINPASVPQAERVVQGLGLSKAQHTEAVALLADRGVRLDTYLYRSLPRQFVFQGRGGQAYIKPNVDSSGVLVNIYKPRPMTPGEIQQLQYQMAGRPPPSTTYYPSIPANTTPGVFTALDEGFAGNYGGSADTVMVRMRVSDLVEWGAKPYPDAGTFGNPQSSIFWQMPRNAQIPVEVLGR